jgi:hypothetical protein
MISNLLIEIVELISYMLPPYYLSSVSKSLNNLYTDEWCHRYILSSMHRDNYYSKYFEDGHLNIINIKNHHNVDNYKYLLLIFMKTGFAKSNTYPIIQVPVIKACALPQRLSPQNHGILLLTFTGELYLYNNDKKLFLLDTDVKDVNTNCYVKYNNLYKITNQDKIIDPEIVITSIGNFKFCEYIFVHGLPKICGITNNNIYIYNFYNSNIHNFECCNIINYCNVDENIIGLRDDGNLILILDANGFIRNEFIIQNVVELHNGIAVTNDNMFLLYEDTFGHISTFECDKIKNIRFCEMNTDHINMYTYRIVSNKTTTYTLKNNKLTIEDDLTDYYFNTKNITGNEYEYYKIQ